MLPHFFPSATHDKDIVDMDTQQRIRYTSESSMSGTSGYNTTSPGPGNSPNSTGYSPVQSPASVLQNDFSNLTLPAAITCQQNSPKYVQMQNLHLIDTNIQQQLTTMYPNNLTLQYNFQQSTQQTPVNDVKQEYEATLRITEQPVEKFRFRYKSEMHGTHGSLNGTSSQRNVKSFPEVELSNYRGPAIIRCSLFQTNLDSPHSHQLVVRKDDHDICDPHEIKVSEENGYFAVYKNMGIIHTAKKFIVEELLKKKRKRLLFELGRDFLTNKGELELHKQTEKEAKDMNLNQVRLCFEAFRVDDNNFYTPIAKPIYSNPINNRKSAQTGELRITRLSIATGSVSGEEDLILLVEKVSKKNIKVRFFEMNDDELVWESFAAFRESDVHHQYAIVCRTPPYKDKDIDKSVEVFIELVRPLDDERSYPPVSFRYKPRDVVISRKRRKTCSSGSGSSNSNSGSLSSGELPKTIFEQQLSGLDRASLSEEIDRLMNNPDLRNKSTSFTDFFLNMNDDILMTSYENNNLNCSAVAAGHTEKDGVCATETKSSLLHYKKLMISKKLMDTAKTEEQNQYSFSSYIQRIFNIFSDTRSAQPLNSTELSSAAEQITKIFNEHFDKNSESLIHELVVIDNNKLAIPLFKILNFFKLNNILNTILNKCDQSSLHYACLHDRSHYIRPLLKLGCNPNIQDTKGDTALHITVREKHSKCLESFINSAMTLKFNILNYDGFTPLHLAIRGHSYDMASKILKYDETIAGVANSKDGNNALHMVIQQQNLMLVKLILDNPIMVSVTLAQNTAGHTPLDLAKLLTSSSKQGPEILNLLLSHNKHFSSVSNTISSLSDNLRMSMDDVDDGKIVVKEEDNSCSSTEDDEDDDASSLEPIPPTMSITHEIEIKEENHDYFDLSDLKAALSNNDVFTKLCISLDKNKRWQKFADKLQIEHFYLTNAEGLLNKIKRNIQTTDLTLFALALQDIDKNLIELIKKQ